MGSMAEYDAFNDKGDQTAPSGCTTGQMLNPAPARGSPSVPTRRSSGSRARGLIGRYVWPQFAFLRTYKPMLKAARGTPHYAHVRLLLQNWLWAQHMVRLLHRQNTALYKAARERDALLARHR